jgi:hypothetical protein
VGLAEFGQVFSCIDHELDHDTRSYEHDTGNYLEEGGFWEFSIGVEKKGTVNFKWIASEAPEEGEKIPSSIGLFKNNFTFSEAKQKPFGPGYL